MQQTPGPMNFRIVDETESFKTTTSKNESETELRRHTLSLINAAIKLQTAFRECILIFHFNKLNRNYL